MNDRNKLNQYLTRAAGIAFGISFLMALVLFGDIGRSIISAPIAKAVFIACGGIGLVLNVITFQSGKFHPLYNLFYWLGSTVVFIGLVFLLMHWPYAKWILIAGMLGVGASFFLPKHLTEKPAEDSELLDN